MKLRFLLAVTGALALATTQAATFTVTVTDDSGPGSLRQAILDANATPGDDMIIFAINGTLILSSPLPPVTDNTAITGPGTNQLTVSGNNAVQVISFNAGTTNNLSDLTIANGLATGYANGAAIANAGQLTIRDCALLTNTNLGGWGGALFNSGHVMVINSTFSGNQVLGDAGQGGGWNNDYSCGPAMGCGGGGGAGMGGAVFSTLGSAVIRGCNFVTNRATGGNGGDFRADGCGRGGGINGGAGNFTPFGTGGNGGFGGGGGGCSAYGYPGHGGYGGFGGGDGGTGGGSGPANGGGGSGLGGAVFVDTGTVTIIGCSFAGNQVAGGTASGADFFNRAGRILPTLTATTLGGGNVTVDPPGPPYLTNSWATLTATPSSGWRFLYWLGDATGTNETTSVRVTRDKFAQAVFGTPLTGSALMSLYPEADFYPYATVVKLTALPPAGTYFASWSGGASDTNNPLSLTVTNPNQSVSVQLSALSAGQVALTIIEIGRGQVSVAPLANPYVSGQSVTLTAIPDVAQDFFGWSGDASGTLNPIAVTMDANKVITANFSKRPRLRVGTPIEGLVEDGFRLTLSGEFGTPYVILGSTNLLDRTTVGTVTNSYGTVQLTDPAATNAQYRFYRAVSQ